MILHLVFLLFLVLVRYQVINTWRCLLHLLLHEQKNFCPLAGFQRALDLFFFVLVSCPKVFCFLFFLFRRKSLAGTLSADNWIHESFKSGIETFPKILLPQVVPTSPPRDWFWDGRGRSQIQFPFLAFQQCWIYGPFHKSGTWQVCRIWWAWSPLLGTTSQLDWFSWSSFLALHKTDFWGSSRIYMTS